MELVHPVKVFDATHNSDILGNKRKIPGTVLTCSYFNLLSMHTHTLSTVVLQHRMSLLNNYHIRYYIHSMYV